MPIKHPTARCERSRYARQAVATAVGG